MISWSATGILPRRGKGVSALDGTLRRLNCWRAAPRACVHVGVFSVLRKRMHLGMCACRCVGIPACMHSCITEMICDLCL